MTFEIELNGRGRTVSIERARHGQYRVTVDGVAAIVDARRSGESGVSLLFPDQSHEGVAVHFAQGPSPGEMLAYLGGRSVAVSVNGRRTGRAAVDSGAGAHGEQKVLAPMPGRVVRVLVAAGDEVQARQPIVVIEAMKMENELRSPKAGRVKDVTVTPGTSVEAGRVLVVIE
jgi:biotin carboxyl carrier protein